MFRFIKENIFIAIIFVITLSVGFLTLLTFINKSFIELTESNLQYLLLSNIVLLIIFFYIIFREIKNSLKNDMNVRGSVANRKYITFFSLFTLIPSVLIAVFSTFLFSFALEKYLDNKITTAVNNSYELAKNYVDEKRNKIELHFIGHLQSNKARKAVELFDVIQTVDSIKLAGRINSICKERHIRQHIYLQVNTGEDPQKHGISVKNLNSVAQEITKMENLILEGIMTIPPYNTAIKELRMIYRKTRKIRDKICSTINENCQNLSMGMSNDYEMAISEGSTHIRIGTSLFGPRP